MQDDGRATDEVSADAEVAQHGAKILPQQPAPPVGGDDDAGSGLCNQPVEAADIRRIADEWRTRHTEGLVVVQHAVDIEEQDRLGHGQWVGMSGSR